MDIILDTKNEKAEFKNHAQTIPKPNIKNKKLLIVWKLEGC